MVEPAGSCDLKDSDLYDDFEEVKQDDQDGIDKKVPDQIITQDDSSVQMKQQLESLEEQKLQLEMQLESLMEYVTQAKNLDAE